MGIGAWITIALAVLGFLLGLLGAVIGFAIRAMLKTIELQLSHAQKDLDAVTKSLGRDDSRMESSIASLRRSIDEVQDEGRAADTYIGTIVANMTTQVAVLRTVVEGIEKKMGTSTSSARFPKARQLSEPPAFLPTEARVAIRHTGVESSGRYAAYSPPVPRPGPKEPKR